MDSLLDYMDMLEDLFENSKSSPFSNKVSVEKERVFDLIAEIRMNLPIEMRQAQRISEDYDKIIAEAKLKGEHIIDEARITAQEMADEHEIYKIAVEQAKALMDETKKGARDMRMSAIDYADDILSKTENAIRESMSSLNLQYRAIEESFSETIAVLYENRQELRGNKS